MFLPYIQNAQNPMMQNAMSQFAQSQYRRGLQGSGVSASQQLGLQGMYGNQAVSQAFQNAMGLAGQRASIWAGGSPPLTQPNYNMANAIGRIGDIGLTAYGIYRNSQNNTPNAPTGDYGSNDPSKIWGVPTPSRGYGGF